MFPLLGVIISCLCFACLSLFRSLLSKSISLPTLTQQGYFISSKHLSWSEIINLIIACPHYDNLRNFAVLLAVINNILVPYQPPPRVCQDSLVNIKKKKKVQSVGHLPWERLLSECDPQGNISWPLYPHHLLFPWVACVQMLCDPLALLRAPPMVTLPVSGSRPWWSWGSGSFLGAQILD